MPLIVSNILIVIALVLAIIFIIRPASAVMLGVSIILICAALLANWYKH